MKRKNSHILSQLEDPSYKCKRTCMYKRATRSGHHTGRTSLITPTDSSPALCTLTNISGINHGPSFSPPTKIKPPDWQINIRKICFIFLLRIQTKQISSTHNRSRIKLCKKVKSVNNYPYGDVSMVDT